jgi:hypothetical protein
VYFTLPVSRDLRTIEQYHTEVSRILQDLDSNGSFASSIQAHPWLLKPVVPQSLIHAGAIQTRPKRCPSTRICRDPKSSAGSMAPRPTKQHCSGTRLTSCWILWTVRRTFWPEDRFGHGRDRCPPASSRSVSASVPGSDRGRAVGAG